ncbi:hypothetical protein MYX75_06965 [Acidobacteria bacterium AH-259-A15]|nr:hypothetical protein [Acidobacteria bacterium AH-259-A15]
MKINITKKEYLTLLEILEIADWVLHAHHTEERSETRKYREIEQKILSYAKDMGFEDLVSYDSQVERYFPTRKFEDTSPGMEFVREFENDTFWEELVYRLVERDLIRQVGEERLLSMAIGERFEREEPLEKRYADEFYNHGLDNLTFRS